MNPECTHNPDLQKELANRVIYSQKILNRETLIVLLFGLRGYYIYPQINFHLDSHRLS